MNGTSKGELILFPKTIDYYQIELTKLLETEAYSEAIRLLEFLLECKTDDARTNEEWHTLLQWLKNEFPHTQATGEPVEEEAEGEEELRRLHVSQRATKDKQYASRLLESLNRTSIDKQLLALDQLGYLQDESIVPSLIARLSDTQLHPFVSFKLLQTLAKQGASGEVTFGKLGEIITVDVERTPLNESQFPDPLPLVAERVNEAAEVDDPTAAYFAKQTWDEFLRYSYGTAVYRSMVGMNEQEIDIWSSALHASVLEAMYGTGNEEECKERYGITESLRRAWDHAYRSLAAYFRASDGFHV